MKFSLVILFMFNLTRVYPQMADSVAIKTVDSLIVIASMLDSNKKFDQALQVLDIADSIAILKISEESNQYATSCLLRGNILESLGEIDEAEKVYIKVKSIREKVLGKEHIDYSISVNHLARLNYYKGNYNLALDYYNETRTLVQKHYGDDHPQLGAILTNLGILFSDMGNYEKAELILLEALKISEKNSSKVSVEYANCLRNLAGLYYELGNFKEAELYFLEDKFVREKLNGAEDSEFARSLSNLATLYIDMHNYSGAENLLLEAGSILERRVGKNDQNYNDVLFNLGALYAELGQYKRALPIFLEVNDWHKKSLGDEHPDYGMSLNNVGEVYYFLGEYKNAEELFNEASNCFEKSQGKESYFYSYSQIRLANSYEIQAKYNRTDTMVTKLYLAYQRRLSNASSFMSDQELAIYISTLQDLMSNLNSYLFYRFLKNSSLGEMPGLAFQYSLFNKGFLLNDAIRSNKLAESSLKGSEIKEQLKNCRKTLSVEYTKPISERINCKELEDKASRLEKRLRKEVSGYADATRQLNWRDIQSKLKPGEAAIEFSHFQLNFPRITDSIFYAAIILKAGKKEPLYELIFEERSLDSLLHSKMERKADYVNNLYSLTDRGAIAIEQPRRSLYEILLKPLEKHLEGITTIYFSPSGLLHRINLDAIPISETETLADRYNLIELNSTRQRVIPTQIKNVNNDAVLFGGIQFEQNSTLLSDEPLLASRSRGELSFHAVDTTLRGGSWNYLAGTEREVYAIEKMMQTSGVQAKLKKGYQATEESFKNIGADFNPSPRVLHIATHGYFFPDTKSNGKNSATGGENVFKTSDHPMLRSGLIMAGGNAAWQGKQALEGREDGILTAYEISQMNLSNTELVVLSACETGLGEIHGNEGVYGLQRAFKIAGAKYLIMSLWQVPDKQTSLLMITFYKNWLELKMSIPDAFHAAQKELREIGLDPYQWAGFVLVE